MYTFVKWARMVCRIAFDTDLRLAVGMRLTAEADNPGDVLWRTPFVVSLFTQYQR
jgi:hypothetical protein